MAVVGLDYPAVKFTADNLDIEWSQDIFCKIKLLESWYLKHLNKDS